MIPFTSLDSVTTVGVGASLDLEEVLTNHLMLVNFTGSPGSVVVALEISHDGVNWTYRGEASGGGGPHFVKITDEPARYVRANLTTFSGGTSPTLTATIASA